MDAFCCKKYNKPDKIIDFSNQTREIEGRVDGARISTLNETDNLLSYYYPDAKTLYELFLKGKEVSNDGDCYGWKPSKKEAFEWRSYSQVKERAEHVGSALIELGFKPATETFVGIFAKNRVEWCLTDQACSAYSFVNVPLYDTLGEEAIDFILNQTQLRVVVCDDSLKAMDLMKRKSNLTYIIVIDEIDAKARLLAKDKNINLIEWKELIHIGKDNYKPPVPPKPNDLATICYTSGTTGMPKGALITHLNMVSVVSSVIIYLKKMNISVQGEQERFLSYLPLAHMMERVAQATLIGIGGKIGFYQGDIKLLLNDLKDLEPTIFVTVPRLLQRIYGKIQENLEQSSIIKKKIFKWAFAHKEKEILAGVVRSNGRYDFAFKTVRSSMGGHVKIILTGSAPISPDVLYFMKVVSGCYVIEGYGATESTAAAGMQIPGDISCGNVGPPFLCSMYKLADVPEMDLVAARDNKGEICVAGANVFKGYYKDPEKTKSVIKDEWYHTGDIGSFDNNGCLKIVDRVKNIFKLQQGEYIAPEKIENIYVKSIYVAQIFVYGNSLKNNLIAIVVPEEERIFEWAKENNCEQDMRTLCQNSELNAYILKNINDLGKEDGLKGFEQVKRIHLHYELFSLEKGLLTPTLKAKRNDLKKYFQKELDALYEGLD